MPKPKSDYQDLFDRARSVMKTKQDNNVIDWTNAVYAKNNFELWWSIRLSVVFEEK